MMPSNVCILDLETQHSADDCRWCMAPDAQHHADGACAAWEGERPPASVHQFAPIGWDAKLALGLSVGCYWDGADAQLHWFDPPTLEATVRLFVARQPLLVSFNGITFDFALMRALLRHEAERRRLNDDETAPTVDHAAERAGALMDLCDAFKTLCSTSYDILRELWKQDPTRKHERGLNSLDALCRANGLPVKEMTGAEAPRLWREGRYAEVIQYNAGDAMRTKALFTMICAGQPILCGDGQPITLPRP